MSLGSPEETPSFTRFPDETPAPEKMLTYATIKSTGGGITQTISMPFPYWELNDVDVSKARDLPGEALRMAPIIGIHPRDVVAARQGDALVDGIIHAPVRFAEHPQVRIFFKDLQGAVRGNGIDNDVLKVLGILSKDALHCLGDEGRAVIRGGDDADQGLCH